MCALAICDFLVSLQIFSLVYKSPTFYEAFGFSGSSSVYVGFTLFQDLSKVKSLISRILANTMTRAIEFEADNFAATNGHRKASRNALVKLESKNLSATNTDWLYAIYSLSHPTLAERLHAIGVSDGKS